MASAIAASARDGQPAAGIRPVNPLAAAPGTAPAVVRLEAVSKSYGSWKAVEELSLDIRKGEILTLLGPSGCGKTTTLRMVIGLEKCTSGTVWHDDRPVDAPASRVFVPPHKRNMGMVFQSYAIWPHMTVAENVGYPLRVRGHDAAKVRDKVRNVLDLVGLGGFGERPAPQLSGGQQQRVALARSLVFEPDLLLLDEPFSNLDATLREQMRVEVKVLQRRLGITVLFVTHDQIEALSLSDRIAVMHRGKLAQLGAPQDLYQRPTSPIVRDFIGKFILLEGTVTEHLDGGEAAVTLVDDPGSRFIVRRTVGELKPGQRCCLAARPEHVLVEAAGAGRMPARSNVLDGVVEALLFLGDRYEARVRLPWGQSVLATVPPEEPPSEGDAVRLRFQESKIQVWQA